MILIFVVVYVPEAREQLNIYPEDSLKEAVVKYRDDEDMQNLIDAIQELVSVQKDFIADITRKVYKKLGQSLQTYPGMCKCTKYFLNISG